MTSAKNVVPFLVVCAKWNNFACMVKTNSLYAWWLAIRPKTLTGAAAPVMVALAAAWQQYGHIDVVPAVLCLMFALLMQVDANLVNDYFDCIHGVDGEERLGPERACSQGWITLPAMRSGIAMVTLLACVTGLPLVLWDGWECVVVGLACVIFCFLYTTLFSRIALGDMLVLLFFGIVPVGYTFYFQSPHASILQIPVGVWILALAQGIITDCLLLVNNFRDRDTDAAVGKITLVTLIGPKVTLCLFYGLGFLAIVLGLLGIRLLTGQHTMSASIMLIIWFGYHERTGAVLRRIYRGKRLNMVLGMTAKSIILFATLVSFCLITQW